MYRYKVVLSSLTKVHQSQYIDSDNELSDKEVEAIARSQECNNVWHYQGVNESSIEIESVVELRLKK